MGTKVIYFYRGSKKETRHEILSIGYKLGLQHCRGCIGDVIAINANKGIKKFVDACENNFKFFSKEIINF